MRLSHAVFGAFIALAGCVRSAGPIGMDHEWVWDGFVPDAKVYVSDRLNRLEQTKPLLGGALFLGDSITEMAPLKALFPDIQTKNYGIGGDTSDGLLARMPQVLRNGPDRVFLMIGTNDHMYDHTPDRIAVNVAAIVVKMRVQWPQTEIYVLSIPPLGAAPNTRLSAANALIQQGAAAGGYVWLDLVPALSSASGGLNPQFTYDGVHLNRHGYAAWAKQIRGCVEDGCPDGLPQDADRQG